MSKAGIHAAVDAYFIYPFGSICAMIVSFLIVAIAHERYSAISGNHKIRNKTEKNRMLLIYLAIVFVPSLAVNFVKFFEISWIQIGDSTFVVATPLRTNRFYSIFYVGWTKVITAYLLPLSALIYFSFKIIRAVKFAARQGGNQEEGK